LIYQSLLGVLYEVKKEQLVWIPCLSICDLAAVTKGFVRFSFKCNVEVIAKCEFGENLLIDSHTVLGVKFLTRKSPYNTTEQLTSFMKTGRVKNHTSLKDTNEIFPIFSAFSSSLDKV